MPRATKDVSKRLEKLEDFYDDIFKNCKGEIQRQCNKAWRSLIVTSFYRRRMMGLKVSNRLANAMMITVPSKNNIHFETRLLYRKDYDGEGGACQDYAQILFTGYSGAGMGKWMARSETGKLIDKQLTDGMGNPMGTHGSMPPYLKGVMNQYRNMCIKIIGDIVMREFNKLNR